MTASPEPRKTKLLDHVREVIRFKHFSLRTEQTYVQWIKRFIIFHRKQHPETMGAAEVTKFLTDLAVNKNVAAATQNQAFGALVFLYREVLKQDLLWIEDIERAKRPPKCRWRSRRRKRAPSGPSCTGPRNSWPRCSKR